MKTVAFHTLGCKVNQYDSQAMLEAFLRAGYTMGSAEESCDVYVINTCTVTGIGDKKSMQAIRRVRRLNPHAEIVIAGCLAQREAKELFKTGARLIIGNARRGEIVLLLEDAVRRAEQVCAVEDILRAPFEPLSVSGCAEHTRAVLKIQEGCDRYCSYCIIPSVRGGVRSRPSCEIRNEARRLSEAGFRELVLTGIHLTSYGRDLEGESLITAIAAAHDAPGVLRIRLGSLEPVVATDGFIGELLRFPKLCPQFHLALQSGSDSVLRRMRRRYTVAEFSAAADNLRAAFPGCALTTDVLCGFPGETDAEHAETMAFCRKIAFARMHVFPYSSREGTPAADMPDQVVKAVREQRARELIALGKETASAYRRAQLGSVREVLFESVQDGVAGGYTPEYMFCEATGAQPGQTLSVRLTKLTPDGFAGEIEAS